LSKVGVDVKIELFKKIDDMQNERKVALKALVKAVSNTALKIQDTTRFLVSPPNSFGM